VLFAEQIELDYEIVTLAKLMELNELTLEYTDPSAKIPYAVY